MLTYVINTSENKVLKSDLLFELVGYNKICWMRSPLDMIGDCAADISKKQQPMTAGDYRVAVLVDFMAFDKTLFPEDNPVSEYLAIYRKLIEVYLYEHLYLPLRRSQLGFCGLEVFYIQYTEKSRILENAAEREQLAALLSETEDEVARIVAEKSVVAPIEPVEAEEKPKRGKAAEKTEEPAAPVLPRYGEFTMEYRGGRLVFPAKTFCKELDTEGRATFECFYKDLAERHGVAMRAFGAYSKTYVAGAASARSESRAAFDNLNLSFALIRAYEQEISLGGDSREDVLDVPKMNKEAFFDTLRHSYGKVQSALEMVRQRGNSGGFYALETKKSVSDDIVSDTMTDEERHTVIDAARGVKFEKCYEEICALAAIPEGEKSPAEREAIAGYMAAYKEKRDDMRKNATEEDMRQLLQSAKRQDKFPAGIEYETAVEKKKTTLRKILQAAIRADYASADYTKEFEDANDARDRYVSGKARLEKYVRTAIVCFFIVMLATLVPYYFLQLRDVPSVLLPIALLVAGGIFAGVFILSALLHVIPILRDIISAKVKMTNAYESCMLKQAQSLLCLKRRYNDYLPAVEQIRYELDELKTLYTENRKINLHIEDHREMLERVRDALLGMLTSMQVAHKADGEVVLDDDEFKIGESFRANRVYKIFTIDVIEEIFGEGRM